MFSIEIKINGSMIAHIYGHNEGVYDDYGRTKYTFEVYEVSKGIKGLKAGEVFHHRGDGIFPLIGKIIEKT